MPTRACTSLLSRGSLRFGTSGHIILPSLLAIAALVGCGDRQPTRVEDDLATLRSSDGLYTAPQIHALAGDSLGDTAYATAAAAKLGKSSPLDSAGIARLKPSPEDDQAWIASYRLLLSRAGAPVRAPTRAAILRVWRTNSPALPAVASSSRLDALVTASRDRRARYRDLPASARALIVRTIAATRPEPAATVQLQRVNLMRYAGRGPDRSARSAVSTRLADRAKGEDRSVELSSVLELGALLGRSPDRDQLEQAAQAAIASNTPAAAYSAVHAFSAAKAPLDRLAPLGDRLVRLTGPDGAVPERAVFPGLPKATWQVAQIRKEVGAPALPDAVLVRVSRSIPKVAARDRSDPDAASYLFGAAKLAGLEYEGTTLTPPTPPAERIDSAQDAVVWAQRAAIAGPLGTRVGAVRVRPFRLGGEAQLGAAGAVLETARRLSVRVTRPASWTADFKQRAGEQRFKTARAATQVSAGLAALGDDRGANRIISRDVRLGCKGFAVLVSDKSGECDLESTLLLLRMRDKVPAADRLAKRITSTE